MEIQINTNNIRLNTEEFLLLFRSFGMQEKEKIFCLICEEMLVDEISEVSAVENSTNHNTSACIEDVEEPDEDVHELSDETKALLNQRIADYEANPTAVNTWDEVKKSINKKYGYGI